MRAIPMFAASPPEKHRIRGEEARELLIAAVLSLVDTIAFQEVTARRIAHVANIDPNAIFRHFGSVEGLLIAAVRQIEVRALAQLSTDRDTNFTLIHDADLYIRLTSWLTLSGVAPERLATEGSFVAMIQSVTLERIGADPALSARSQRALFTIALSFISAQALLTPTQPEFFTTEVINDSAIVMAKLVETMAAIADDLGWN